MQSINYRGIQFDVVETLEHKITPVKSSDNMDYLYSRVDITVLVLLNPQAGSFTKDPVTGAVTAIPGQLATLSEAAVRHTLAQPRGLLVVKTWGGIETLRSPATVSSTTLPADPFGGPFCEVLGSPVIHSDKTWQWALHFTTFIRECPAKTPRVFLSHRITQTHDVNELSFTDIYTNGKAVVDLGALIFNDAITSIDALRSSLFFPVPTGFQRTARVTLDSTGSQLEYTILDKQVAIGYDATVAQKILVTQTASWHAPGAGGILSALVGTSGIGVHASPVGERGDAGRPHRPFSSAFRSLASLGGALSGLIPQYTNSVNVQVYGSPTSTRNKLTALALAIALNKGGGNFFIASSTGDLVVTEDIAGKFSEIIMTTVQGVDQAIAARVGAGAGVPTAPGAIGTVIDSFRVFGVAGGGPTPLTAAQKNALAAPFNNFTVAESITIPDTFPGGAGISLDFGPGLSLPPPAGDKISRGTWLVNLVYSILLGPCQGPASSNPAAPGGTLP